MDAKKFQFVTQIIDALPYDYPKEKVPKVVDASLWFGKLDVTEAERQEIINAVVWLLSLGLNKKL